MDKINKNINIVDETESTQTPSDLGLKYSDTERDILLFLKERYDAMHKKKKDLGIDYKCNLYDRLYTPHRVLALKDDNKEFEDSHLKIDEDDSRQSNKSKPIAFEKVQTALAIMIKQNPKAAMRAYGNRWKALNEIVKRCYENNWDENRLIIELRRFVFHLAKYGIAYGRRYIKKTYKIARVPDEKDPKKTKKERVVDFYDTVWETIHPKNIILDDTASNPRDARDVFIVFSRSLQELKDRYPKEKFPRIVYIDKGSWLTKEDGNIMPQKGQAETTKVYEEMIYENVKKDIKITVINGVLISGDDDELPGNQLSVFGEKWADKDESYDGIGICQVLENYQPLIDDISNADVDLVREMVRPKLYIGSGVKISDEAEDEVKGQQIIRFEGDLNQVKWDRPTRTGDGVQMKDSLMMEIDDATGISKDLSAGSEAKTLGQASYNRENSLRRLSLPLESIKYAIEDDANKALPLLKILNSNPISTYEIENPKELEEAMATLVMNPGDERFVMMPSGKLVRRKFKEIEMNIDFDTETKSFSGTEASQFFEQIPSTYDWKGKINIVPMSFLGESESMEQQAALQDLNILLPIQDVDPNTGQPILLDESGNAYKINKVKLLKNYIKSRQKNPDEILIALQEQNVAAPMELKPLTNPDNLTPTANQKMGLPASSNSKPNPNAGQTKS